MAKNMLVAPVVKWVGGKRQLLDEILPLLPKRMATYCEPFLGGGAVFLAKQPTRAIVNDLNKELISVYEVIRDELEELLGSLEQHKNTADYFYAIRDVDRNKETYRQWSKVEKASRLLYLNKTCFNGLFRVNSSGEFNSPFGFYKNPNIINEPVLRAVSRYFNASCIEFYSEDFAETLARLPKNAFVYLDPPYDPVSDTANFTGYNKGGFGREEQIRLKRECDKLTERGIKFMLSNSRTQFIQELYGGNEKYRIITVNAKRMVNSVASRRGNVEEVLVVNYETGR